MKYALILISIFSISILTVNAGVPEGTNNVMIYLEKIHYTVGNIWSKVLNIQTRVGDLEGELDKRPIMITDSQKYAPELNGHESENGIFVSTTYECASYPNLADIRLTLYVDNIYADQVYFGAEIILTYEYTIDETTYEVELDELWAEDFGPDKEYDWNEPITYEFQAESWSITCTNYLLFGLDPAIVNFDFSYTSTATYLP